MTGGPAVATFRLAGMGAVCAQRLAGMGGRDCHVAGIGAVLRGRVRSPVCRHSPDRVRVSGCDYYLAGMVQCWARVSGFARNLAGAGAVLTVARGRASGRGYLFDLRIRRACCATAAAAAVQKTHA